MPHFESGAAQNRQRLGIVFGLTAAFMVAEVAAGFWTNSLALLADAGHMLADAGALGLALLAIRFAAQGATPQKTYGYHRAEILAALANSAVLLVISFFILYEAWVRFQDPPRVAGTPMLAVAVAGLAVNLVGAFLLHSGAGESLNVKGAYLEVLSDTLGSLGVIVASVLIWTKGWYLADPIISAGIGLFIVPRTWSLIREATHILMEGAPAHIDQTELEQAVAQVDGVREMHDLHIWTVTSGYDALSAHVTVEAGCDYDDTLRRLEHLLEKRFGIRHCTLQLETKAHSSAMNCR